MTEDETKAELTAGEWELYSDACYCISNQLNKVPIAQKAKVALESLVAERKANAALRKRLKIAVGYIESIGHDDSCFKGRSDSPEMEPDPCTCGLDLTLFELKELDDD